jgi:putative FmdB family regulatory protein
MPTYVYKCNECGHVFEVRQHFSDEPLTDCPKCEDGEVRRVINNVSVVFKGSGFYVTDSRNGKNGTLSSNGTTNSSKSAEKTSESPSTSKAENKSSAAETEKS